MEKEVYYWELESTKDRECFLIRATSWNGEDEVVVITPVKPTEEEIKETIDLLLGELDDHDAVDEYLRKIGKGPANIKKLYCEDDLEWAEKQFRE